MPEHRDRARRHLRGFQDKEVLLPALRSRLLLNPQPLVSHGLGAALARYSWLHLLEATSSSARHKLCYRLQAEQGKEFWRRLFRGKITCDGGDTLGAV
jgi:hypothetical protein